MTLTVLNPMAILSPVIKLLGAIKTELLQRPTIQPKEISCEDFLEIMRMINGMSHKGMIIAAQKPIVFTNISYRTPLAPQYAVAAWPIGQRDLCKRKEFDQDLHAFIYFTQGQ